MATQHRKQTATQLAAHWTTVMAWLGKPTKIKTDNGPCFQARSTEEWCKAWNIVLKHGIAYNSTGQAIVERAHRTLKAKIIQLGEGEGYKGAIPVAAQQTILMRALYSLNHFIRGQEQVTAVEKHFGKAQAGERYPQVRVRFPGSEQWERGWKLRCLGRGYAAVENEGRIEWVPAKCVKAELCKDVQ